MPKRQTGKDNKNTKDDNKDEQYEFLRMPFGFKMSTSAYNQALAAAKAPRDKPEDDKRDNNNPDDDEEPDVKPTGVPGQDLQIKTTPNTREEIRDTGMEKLSKLNPAGLLDSEIQATDARQQMDQGRMKGRTNYNNWNRLGLLGAILVLSAWLGPTEGYTIAYADCARPEGIRQYAKTSLCQDPEMDLMSKDQSREYTLVQKAHSQTIHGYAFELQTSTFRAYFGVYGHVKIGQSPEIAHHVTIGREECETMIRTLQYPGTDRDEPIPLQMNQPA